jgi:acyl carrier protein
MLSTGENNKVMTLKELALQPLEFRVNYVEEFVKRLLSSWSGADAAELDLNVGLHKYGIDSIAATNMKLQIQNNIGATFEVSMFKYVPFPQSCFKSVSRTKKNS